MLMLDQAQADRIAAIVLGHITQEYPHALSHVFSGPADAKTPRMLHPVFYGSFDWHSCVHGYWTLATLLHRFPTIRQADTITTLFDAHLTAPLIAGECAYFDRAQSRGFERSYGWAWLLALQHALHGTVWGEALRPLSAIVRARFHDYLPKALYPVRTGTHFNAAFSLTVMLGHVAQEEPGLLAIARGKAREWYGADADCQAWEPSQDEFLSPTLMEAVCMQRLLPAEFAPWFRRFLPGIAAGRPATLFEPAVVSDRTDGKIAHLDGLNLSRAWCWRELAKALGPSDALTQAAQAAARRHIEAALPHIAGDFMGEHWLATFAVLATLEDALPGIGPDCRPPAASA